METWQNIKVSNLGNINDGDWILNKNYSKSGVRLLQVGDIGLGKFVDKTNKFISESTAGELNVSIVSPGKDILIARMPDPIGRACIAPFLPYKYIVAVDISILTVDERQFDIRYIMQLLNSQPILSKVQQKSAGATRIRISRTNLESIKLKVPKLFEQTAIANILSTVDEAIQKADEAITKTERIKQAVMQKLLSEGIGHKEFKQTKIGKIPKAWGTTQIKELGVVHTGKTPSSFDKSLWIGNISFVTPGDISDSKYVMTTERTVSEKGSKVSTLLPRNSLMVVCIGSTIGKVALTSREMITNQQINSLIIDKNKFDADFIYYAFLNASKIFRAFAGTAAVPIINKTLFEKFRVPVSYDKKEQERIGEILSAFDEKLILFQNRKFIFERIKQGLMDDLLTGKKRVKI